MKTPDNPQGIAPPPTVEDRAQIAQIVHEGLGEQAKGSFIGAMARGQRGDAPFYGHAVIIDDPDIARDQASLDDYYEKVGEVARKIGNTSPVAGNVVLDITYLSQPRVEGGTAGEEG